MRQREVFTIIYSGKTHGEIQAEKKAKKKTQQAIANEFSIYNEELLSRSITREQCASILAYLLANEWGKSNDKDFIAEKKAHILTNLGLVFGYKHYDTNTVINRCEMLIAIEHSILADKIKSEITNKMLEGFKDIDSLNTKVQAIMNKFKMLRIIEGDNLSPYQEATIELFDATLVRCFSSDFTIKIPIYVKLWNLLGNYTNGIIATVVGGLILALILSIIKTIKIFIF
ncbi:MAG: hypothetical protein ACI4DP_00915 [Candidatus Ornithomonoglobus sp.]